MLTTSSLSSFSLATVKDPEVMEKAQAKLDRVVRFGGSPEFNDRPSLPYIDALVKEVSRCFPDLPTGKVYSSSVIIHRASEVAFIALLDLYATVAEDIYNSHRIPAGSTVIANSRCIINWMVFKVLFPLFYTGEFCMILSYIQTHTLSTASDSSRTKNGILKRILSQRKFSAMGESTSFNTNLGLSFHNIFSGFCAYRNFIDVAVWLAVASNSLRIQYHPRD